jgi:hypothetical protein
MREGDEVEEEGEAESCEQDSATARGRHGLG